MKTIDLEEARELYSGFQEKGFITGFNACQSMYIRALEHFEPFRSDDGKEILWLPLFDSDTDQYSSEMVYEYLRKEGV